MGIDIRVVYQWLYTRWVIVSAVLWIAAGCLYGSHVINSQFAYLLYKWWVIASLVLWGIVGLAYLAMKYASAHPEQVTVSKVGYNCGRIGWIICGWFLHDLWYSPNHGFNLLVVGTLMALMILWFLFVSALTLFWRRKARS